MCKNIIDRLLDPPSHSEHKRAYFWIHAAGGMAMDRASEIALNLCNRFYPNQLEMFIYTDTLKTEEEYIRVTADSKVVEKTALTLKPALHIRLAVTASLSSSGPRSVQLSIPSNYFTTIHIK
ncbi:unnamed protein product [Mesocestoides corti]|uniref:Alba domain-containing protein n=1 Tax=Mesocestoides corti TaxID=53468 RepID=A0A0R3UAN5_MESCO|nr:unnamed protein product [Mesocestoides corti]